MGESVDGNPLLLFPEEVWGLIFDQLNSESQILLNCSRTCTTFDRILKPTQCDWLFDTVYPFIFPYLGCKEVLSCRRISKRWRRVVDHHLENFESRRPFNKSRDISHSSRYNPLSVKKIKWTFLERKEHISKFIEDLKNQKRNPFVGRSLWLCDVLSVSDPEQDQRQIKEYWNSCTELVSLFGHHVWYFTIGSCGSSSYNNAREFYLELKQKLGYLPNLRSLHVFGRAWTQDWNMDEDLFDFGIRSLPKLGSLETLDLSYLDESFPSVLIWKLISELNPDNLRCLHLDILSNEFVELMESLDGSQPLVLPKLNELHISISNVEHLEEVFRFMSPQIQIEKLVVSLGMTEFKIDFHHLCNVLNRFGKTLTMLCVKCDIELNEVGQEEGTPRENLSSFATLEAPLKRLEIDGVTFRSGFLSQDCKKSLEYLHIRNVRKSEACLLRPGMNLNRCVYADELNEAHIWNYCENLKTIRVGYWLNNDYTDVYCTRSMHDYLISTSHSQ